MLWHEAGEGKQQPTGKPAEAVGVRSPPYPNASTGPVNWSRTA
ncbi:hypothetical protein ACIQ8D_31325 [Streptomyces sp. NPDC096094]